MESLDKPKDVKRRLYRFLSYKAGTPFARLSSIPLWQQWTIIGIVAILAIMGIVAVYLVVLDSMANYVDR